MSSGVFKHYAGVSTAIIVFTKTGAGGTDKAWFYDMQTDRFSLDDKRQAIDKNDIPDIISRYHSRMETELERLKTEKSFFVDAQDIRNNNYDYQLINTRKLYMKKSNMIHHQ